MEKVIVLHILLEMELGGIQSLIMDTYRNIDREKVQFHFLVSKKGYYDEEILKLGGKIHFLPHITEVTPWQYDKNMSDFFKKHPEYKIIHSHFGQFSGLIAKIAAKNNIPTIIVHSHNISTFTRGLGRIYKEYIKRYINKYTTDYFACSLDAAKYLFGKNYKFATIIKNGIVVKDYLFNDVTRKKLRKKLNINDDTVVIGHVGRCSRQKNPFFILKIFEEYLKLNSNSKLLLIGDGPLRKELEETIKDHNLNDKVILLKAVKACDYYNVMDYFILPSIYEGLGITLIESQTNGLASFTSTEVPNAANITNKILYLDLSKGASYWAKTIYNTSSKRYNEPEKIIESGYDIKDTAKKLEEFYLQKAKLNNEKK